MIASTLGFAILFGLDFLLFSCEGQVSPPSSGDTFVVLPGKDVTITWTLDVGVPSIDFRSWTFDPKGRFAQIVSDGDVVNTTQNSPGPFTITKPSTLILKNVNIQYNGTYTFLVVSGVKSTASPVHVFVAVKPTVTISYRSSVQSIVIADEGQGFTVDEGQDFTCVCRGENGNPPADVTWKKDNAQTGPSKKEERTLTRSNVTETDSGTYKCVAQSHTLKEEKSIVIKVRPNAKPNVTGITFAPNPAEVGETVTITCVESEGVPKPSYTTSHNGEVVGSEKTFTISVKQSDKGLYECVAKNKLGMDSATANLNVTEPRSTPKPPSPASTSKKQGNGEVAGKSGDGLGVGAIVGIVIGVLVLLVIVIVVVVWRCKLKEKDGYRGNRNVDPVEMDDNAYDTVKNEPSGSKSNPQASTLPVYAAVDKNNREGKPLYATLDTVAMNSNDSKRRNEESKPEPTQYASIDFKRSEEVPRADLV